MKPPAVSPRLRLALLAPALLAGAPAWAAYDCNVSVTSVGVLYTTSPVNQDANGTVTLTCTRASGDANSLTYRIKADNGLNPNGTQRRVRRGTSGNRLDYFLRRGTTVGGAASCGNNTNWSAPTSGNSQVIRDTLSFGTALTASVTWGYCIRVRGNQGSPTAGSYTDTVQVFAQYPGTNAGALTSPASLNYTVGVSNQCVFSSFPTNMVFSYTSFSATPQVASQSFNLRCSNSLPWSLAVSPASTTLLGLGYTLGLSPASGTGTGADESITITGTLPAGQAGTCAAATCSGSQAHVITITY
ncbi:MAG: spore coat protein U domain-containing protein [Ramlibacter sp.]|nr:spore coat protein U domain-containing protein [Ramlibacter sp.]